MQEGGRGVDVVADGEGLVPAGVLLPPHSAMCHVVARLGRGCGGGYRGGGTLQPDGHAVGDTNPLGIPGGP